VKLELKWCHTGFREKVILTLIPLKKLLALSLPLSLASAAVFGMLGSLGTPEVLAAADRADVESPAMLRLTALDTLMKGDKKSAIELYDEAISHASRQFGEDSTFLGDLYYEAGRLYLDMDQFNQAENYLNHAIKINPKNASARLSLAKLLDLREKVQDSLSQTREALMVNPSSPVARRRFVQTLSKYGQKPADQAIATQEALTIAMMQKLARLSLTKPTADKGATPKTAGKKATAPSHPVPTLPKNLTPLKEGDKKNEGNKKGDPGIESQSDVDKAFSTETKKSSSSDTSLGAIDSNAGNSANSSKKSSGALSLFPLQGLSERKKQDEQKKQQAKQEQLKKEAEAQQQKRAEEAQRQAREAGLNQKIREQARQLERAKAESAARASQAAKAVNKPGKSADSKGSSKPDAAKPAQQPAKQQPVQQQQQPIQQQQVQQMPIQMQMQPGFFMQPQAVFPPVNSAPPKSGKKGGFVPPPPPTMNMYPGMQPMVVPQAVPQPQPKPVEKPKVEKPKAAPKEEKQVEDKPPPMTTTGEAADPDFLLDWGELPKNKGQKKKAK